MINQSEPGIVGAPYFACAYCRQALRSALIFFAAAVCLVLSQVSSRAVDIDALIGFGQSTSSHSLYRPETATPLTVYLTGTGFKGVGQLQVTVRQNDRTTTYARKVSLAEGFLKEAHTEGFVFMLQPAEYTFSRNSTAPEINLQLLVDGRQIAHKTLSLPISTSTDSYNVLALTRNGSGLNFLRKKKLGLFHRHTNSESFAVNRMGNVQASANGINPNASLTVGYARPDALPIIAQGYDMMDAVALADMPLDNLTDAQLAALKGYVRNGGLLIVSGGGDLSRLKSQFYSDMLPINITGVASVSDVPALADRYRQPLRLTAPAALVTGSLKPFATSLLDPGSKIPLVTRLPYGAGSVVLTAFDYLDPAFRGWPAAPSLWRDLLRSGNEAVSPRGVLAVASRTGANANLLADALAGMRATNTPGFLVVAIFLGAYIVLLIPVSYFILKKLDRREMAWYTAPVLIGGFTVLSYFIALSVKGGNLNVNRAVVLESQAGSNQFAGYGQMTVYSPRRGSYDIAMADTNDTAAETHDVTPYELFRGQTLGTDLTVEQNGITTLRNTSIGLWDKRTFDMPLTVGLGGPIEASVKLTKGANAQVTVVNKSSTTIKDCAVIDADRAVPIGDLGPGQTRVVSVQWAFNANANIVRIPLAPAVGTTGLPYDPQDGNSAANVAAKLRYAVTQILGQGDQDGSNNYAYMYGYQGQMSNFGRIPNAIVGWTTEPLLRPMIDGKAPVGEEANLVLVHLPAPVNAPQAIQAGYNPFVTAPVLELEDEVGPGGMRMPRRGGM